VPQTDSQRVQVTKQYPAKLFLVTETRTAADRTDTSVCSGDFVWVIKKNDPNNSSKRWLVDDARYVKLLIDAEIKHLHFYNKYLLNVTR